MAIAAVDCTLTFTSLLLGYFFQMGSCVAGVFFKRHESFETTGFRNKNPEV